MSRDALLRAGGLLAAAAAGALVLRSFDLAAVSGALAHAQPAVLAIAVGVVVAQLLARAVRLRSILPPAPEGRAIGVGSLAAAMLVAWLVNALSPARIGDGVKGYLVARRHGLPLAGVLGSIALEHGLDAPSLAVVAAGMGILVGLAGTWRTVTLLAGLAGLAILAVLFAADLGGGGRRLRRWLVSGPRLLAAAAVPLASFGTGFRVAGRRRVALRALVIGLGASLCDALVVWLVADALGLRLSLPASVLIAASISLSTILPGAPGYVGTLELAAVGAAAAVGLVGPGALALALAFHAVQYAPLAIGSLLVVATDGYGVSLPSRGELLAFAPAFARSNGP